MTGVHDSATESTLRARWFDGSSSRARPVLLHLSAAPEGGCSLRLHRLDTADATAPALQLAAGEFAWPDTWEPSSAHPRLTLDLRQHGSLQLEGAAWQAALAACDVRGGVAQRLQRRWRWLIAALLATALVVAAFSRWGTPWAATQLARHAPLEWEQTLSRETLAQLDTRGMLAPSQLPPERQAQLQTAFAQLRSQIPPGLRPYPAYAPTLELQFRAGMGPNAFALPGGTMVLTDAMVELARSEGVSDEALMGVLAHEAGHVLYRHGTRRVIELSLLNGAMALALGDVSGLVNTGGTLLAGLAYSRDHEREADCFVIALMQHAQRPLVPMADLLLAADRVHGGGAQAGALGDWISTHPDTAGRTRDLKSGQGQACPRG